MAEIMKEIPVRDKEEAIRIMNLLTERYQLVLTDPDNSLDSSNEKVHVYYDGERNRIIIETNDSHSFGEYIKEIISDFPTFF
jgi:hypothetical protein